MKFKLGDKVRIIVETLRFYNMVGKIVGIDNHKEFPYLVQFNYNTMLFNNTELEPHYTTHDILEEILA